MESNEMKNKTMLTESQIREFAGLLFYDSFPEHEFGDFEDQNGFTQNDWVNVAYKAIDGYNDVAKHVTFPNVSAVKNCCQICKHVDLCRPACNLRGDNIALECVCSKFELFVFYEDEEGDKI